MINTAQIIEMSMGLVVKHISVREKQVLRLVAQALNNPEIATTLVIAENKVKNDLRNIPTNLRLGNRVQAAAYALGKVWPPGSSEK
jgi:DNA-binding NarL/FixJ family response regulator